MANLMPPSTPQRPTPGAFINTPARSGLSRTTSVPQHPALPAPETPLQRAARTINSMLDRDSRYPSLESYIGQGFSGEYELPTSEAWTPFQKLRTYEHPEDVFDHVNEMQMNTKMGLFAEINHAYVFVDNQLYLWDYTASNPKLIGFEEQGHNITCVKLVRPQSKVFIDNISWILVIATVADIQLIGIECLMGSQSVVGLELYQTSMQVSIRGLNVTAIEGSASTGRIFFGESGSEDVWELTYQQEDRWFSSRCGKKNHVQKSISFPALPFYGTTARVGMKQMVVDDSRKLLYTLSTDSTIKVYHLRSSATLENIITRSIGQIRTMCSHIVRQAAAMDNMRIVGIDPITAPEAEHLSLMATTSTGVRLYLSATSGSWLTDSTVAPTSMAVRHIRFPPSSPDDQPATPSTTTLTPAPAFQGSTPIGFDSKLLTQTVGGFRYTPGSFFCFVEKNPNEVNHTLFISAPHAGQLTNTQEAPRYSETGHSLAIRGKMQDIGRTSLPFSARNQPIGFGNELAVQFDMEVSEYAILTHFGVETVRRRRLVDTFAAIIKSGGGPEGVEADVKRFAKQYGLTETASTALAVACGQGQDVGPDLLITRVTDPEVLEFSRRVFIEYGGKAQLTESAAVEGLSVDNVRASPRHDGIALYVARLIRSIWDTPIIMDAKGPAGLVPVSTVKIPKLQEIQRALIQLQEFLDTNKPLIDGLAGPDAMGRAASRQEEVELQGENRALTSLLQIINNIVEGIAFTLVLFDERLDEIFVLLAPDSQQAVRKLTYHGLFAVSDGKNLARELVKAVVNRNIAKGSNVESVAEALRRKCGSFCSSDDVVIFKAQENLKKAADLGANSERGRSQLNDSLRLFEQVSRSLSREHLVTAVDRYIELQFYAGAVRLALKVAQESDRGNRSLSWLKDGRPKPDARQSVYETRVSCYDIIFKVIEAVDRVYAAQGATTDGAVSQIALRKQEAYDQINNSDDEVFQDDLYDWYLSKGWTDRLLEIESPFVIDYLKRGSETDNARADLLWRYFAQHGNYLGAAEVQVELAQSPLEISLERRIEYLSRAKANASTRMTGFSDSGVRSRQSRQELLRKINDNLDVANIQDDLLQRLKDDVRLVGRRAEVLKALDGVIQPLDDLYLSYADKAGYYDICLYIYHAADHRDLAHIRNTWHNLIEKTHTEAVADHHISPWEMVSLKVEEIGRRVNLDENVFPINVVLQTLLHYHVTIYAPNSSPSNPLSTATHNPDGQLICSSTTWPIDLMVKLDAPFENLVSTLEAVWYAQEYPFETRAHRKFLVKWIIATTEQWFDASRRQGVLFGGAENAIGLADCLRAVLGGGELESSRNAEDARWVERGRVISGKVEEAAR